MGCRKVTHTHTHSHERERKAAVSLALSAVWCWSDVVFLTMVAASGNKADENGETESKQ